jgi:hypothetical protein
MSTQYLHMSVKNVNSPYLLTHPRMWRLVLYVILNASQINKTSNGLVCSLACAKKNSRTFLLFTPRHYCNSFTSIEERSWFKPKFNLICIENRFVGFIKAKHPIRNKLSISRLRKLRYRRKAVSCLLCCVTLHFITACYQLRITTGKDMINPLT